jgi:hypothetical protein
MSTPAPDSPPGARADSLGPRFAGTPRGATCCLVVLVTAILLVTGAVLAIMLPPPARTAVAVSALLAVIVHLVTLRLR